MSVVTPGVLLDKVFPMNEKKYIEYILGAKTECWQ
jgi:hypothetical protein